MEEVTVSQREPQFTAVMRDSCPMNELGARLGLILPTVHEAVNKQGLEPVAPPFLRYFAMDDGVLEFEAGIAVASPFRNTAEVTSGNLPGGETAALWHVGPYEELGPSHNRLDAWLDQQRRRPSGARWEVYWTDPGDGSDPSTWRTEIVQPLAPLS